MLKSFKTRIKKTLTQKLNSGTEVYAIGQVVYILSNKGQSVIPAMIVEESIIKTLSGNTIAWKLALGASGNPKKPQKIVDSSKIDGEIYSSLEEVQAVLKNRLFGFLKKVLADARQREQAWYGSQKKKIEETSLPKDSDQPDPNAKIDPESLVEELTEETPDGPEIMVAPPVSQKQLSEEDQKKALQQRLRRMAEPDDDDGKQSGNSGAVDNQAPVATIEGPNGTRIPVNLKL